MAGTAEEDSGKLIKDTNESRNRTKNIVTSPFPDVPLPSGNAAAYILEKANEWPDRIALVG